MCGPAMIYVSIQAIVLKCAVVASFQPFITAFGDFFSLGRCFFNKISFFL